MPASKIAVSTVDRRCNRTKKKYSPSDAVMMIHTDEMSQAQGINERSVSVGWSENRTGIAQRRYFTSHNKANEGAAICDAANRAGYESIPVTREYPGLLGVPTASDR